MNLIDITRPPLPLAVIMGAGGLAMAAARRVGETHRLLLVDRDSANLAAAAAALRSEGHQVDEALCDVTDRAQVAAMADQARTIGNLRALVHVVGLSPSMAGGDRILEVNLAGPALVAEALTPLVGPGFAGILVASLAAHLAPDVPEAAERALDDPLGPDLAGRVVAALEKPLDPQMAYMLSKRALLRLCQRLAISWGALGGRAVSLSPGLIATPMGIMEFTGSPQKHALLERTPLQRQGSMLEIADAIDFLISPRASFISGVDLLVDGGILAALRQG